VAVECAVRTRKTWAQSLTIQKAHDENQVHGHVEITVLWIAAVCLLVVVTGPLRNRKSLLWE
jgi:hypothetical protein